MKNITLAKCVVLQGVFLLLLVLGTACRSSPPAPAPPTPRTDPITVYDSIDREDKNTLILVIDSSWNGSYLPTYVLKSIFEDQLGYTVEVIELPTVPATFEAVAYGQADIFTNAWFPGRDATFDKYPNLVKLALIYGGKAKDAYEGWMVPTDFAERYGVTHVADLRQREVVNALDTDGDGLGNLIGSPGDWSSAKRHPEILADYGLAELYEIEEPNSEEQMLTTIKERFRQGKPALFYMYQPIAFPGDSEVIDHSVWLTGTEPYLRLAFARTIVRGDLIANHPQAANVLSRYQIPGTDIVWAMGQIAERGKSSEMLTELAQSWIDDHQAEVDRWLEGISERSVAETPTDEALTIAYSPEKEDLFLKLVIAFNQSRPQDTPPIHPVRLNMSDMLQDAVAGEFAAMSPDSSVWLAQLDRMWERKNPDASSLVGQSVRYALSPIVIAMWESRATELGYPNEALGWEDLMQKVLADPSFKWSHPSTMTASGLLATTAEFYAGAGKEANLSREDLASQDTLDYVETIESTVERYGGETEDRVVIRMLAEGGYPLDAFVAQEQLVIFFNQNTGGEKLVAIYPEEGTFWMDHPLVLLDGPWVTEDQQRTFRQFAKFVGEPEQQRLVLAEGYRPGEVAISLEAEGSLIKPDYNVEPSEPKTLLQVPPAGILEDIREVWRLTKKPANIYLVVDVSGSMEGEPLAGAKGALFSFIDQVEGERDSIALVAFSDQVNEVQRLGQLDGDQRESFKSSIRQLRASGGTLLYDAVAYAFEQLQEQADPERINVIVAMTDGQSQGDIAVLESALKGAETPVLLFTVGYGDDADIDTLQRIARMGDGQAYSSDPETIEQLYELLSAFF